MSLRFNALTREVDLGELAANQPNLGSGVTGFADAEVVTFQNSVGGVIEVYGIAPPIVADQVVGQRRKLFVFTAGVNGVKFFNESGSAAGVDSRIRLQKGDDFTADPQLVMVGIYRPGAGGTGRWWLYATSVTAATLDLTYLRLDGGNSMTGDLDMDGNDIISIGNIQHGARPAELLWGNNSVTSTTTDRFLTPGDTDGIAPTSAIQFRVSGAGVLRNLRVRHNTGAGNGNPIVYTVRVNGVATPIAASLASTANDGSDLVNSAALVNGDLVDIKVTKAAGVGTSPSDIVATIDLAYA